MIRSMVTGGAGFIGSALVRTLLKRGDQVLVFDNLSTGKLENLGTLLEKIEFVEGDIRDEGALGEAVEGVDVIFHQAAFVSVPLSVEDPGKCFEINVQGTVNLLEAARRANVSRVVLASSAAVYGDNPALPLREDSSLTSLSPYAASKRADEIYADLYTRCFKLDVVALRYFNVFGPRQSPASDYAAVIPVFIQRMLRGQPPVIFGDGGQTRDFIFVDDVARANLLASQARRAPGQVFNVASGMEISVIELVDHLQKVIPGSPGARFAEPRPGDIYRSYGDPERAREILAFQPGVSFQDGLEKTAAWLQN